jgi:hypothetical protein
MYFTNKLSNTISFGDIFLSFSSDEVQAIPRSSVGGEEDWKSEKSERSERSEPQEPAPEVEAVVAAVNEVEIEKKEEKNATKNVHIQNVCSMCITINNDDKQEVGI